MKKITLFLLFIITISNAQSKKIKTYSDQYLKLSYPKTWKIENRKDHPDNLVILYPKKNQKLFHIIPTTKVSLYKTLKNNYSSLDEYTSDRLDLLLKNTKEANVKTVNSKFGPLKIITLIYKNYISESNLAGINIKLVEYNFMHKNAVYSFYYEAPLNEFDNYLNTSKGIFSSIEMKK